MPKREHVWKTQASAEAFADCSNKDHEDDIEYRARPTVGGWTVVVLDKATREEPGPV